VWARELIVTASSCRAHRELSGDESVTAAVRHIPTVSSPW
jgi:hypothetical protein